MKRVLPAYLAVLLPSLCAGQSSLGPTAPAGEVPHAKVRAAGMPLRDGELPPGTLTVRVVRGDSSNNVPDQPVQMEVTGDKAYMARTGSDGRAQFPHVLVGAQVRAWAVIDGQRLESEMFSIPAESGVRVLLVAGGDAATAPLPPTLDETPTSAGTSTVATVVTNTASPTSENTSVAILKTAMACVTIFTTGLFLFQRRAPRS
jgi:hypothetical protein